LGCRRCILIDGREVIAFDVRTEKKSSGHRITDNS
jgi:hypothetical protein